MRLAFEKTDEEDLDMKTKGSYAAALLKDIERRSISSIAEKKEKDKRDDDREIMASYRSTKIIRTTGKC